MQSNDDDLRNWLTKKETAERLNISTRTLDRLTKENQGPECRKLRRPGLAPVNVYNPDDIAALEAVAPYVMPMTATEARLVAADGVPAGLQLAMSLLEKLATIVQRPQAEAAKAPRYWLTIPQAAEYTGLSEALLRRLVAEGAVTSIDDGWIKVRRAELDALCSLETVWSGQKGRALEVGR